MTAHEPRPRRVYLDPPVQPPATSGGRVRRLALSAVLSPAYLAAAGVIGTPGLDVHRSAVALGLRLLAGRRPRASRRTIFTLLFAPLDSVRYFEIGFVRRALAGARIERFLDVSSPRLVPVLTLRDHPGARGDLLNPDAADLPVTGELIRAAGLADRATTHPSLIADAPFAPGTFDVVTTVSVVEHIPDDRDAVARMWALLRPGGRLVVTVPCAREATEEFISRDEYGVLQPTTDGYTFWQRFYDEALLRERLFGVAGEPARMEVYGERVAGALQRNAALKRADSLAYPGWREPYMMGREFRRYATVDEMPGQGVVGLEFRKPA